MHRQLKIITAAVVTALIACAAVLGDDVDLLSMISLFYYANLLCNVVFSFVEFRKNPCIFAQADHRYLAYKQADRRLPE